MKVNIKGLERGEVLAALFNDAKPQGLGVLQFVDRKMTPSDGEYMFLQGDYFDYLEGRVIKTEIKRGAEFIDSTLYDRDNGDGAAARAIGILRQRKDHRCENFFIPERFMQAERKNWQTGGLRGFQFEILGGRLTVYQDFGLYYLNPTLNFDFRIEMPGHETVTVKYSIDHCEDEDRFVDIALHAIFELIRKVARGDIFKEGK